MPRNMEGPSRLDDTIGSTVPKESAEDLAFLEFAEGDINTIEQPQDTNAPEQATPELETVDNREVSPLANMITTATTRLTALLETRAINKAHGEALIENTARDRDAQNAAFATYDQNVATTQDRENVEAGLPTAREQEMNDLHGEALKDNRAFDRNKRYEANKERFVTAKDKMMGWGGSALRFAKTVTLVTLGVQTVDAEAAGTKAGLAIREKVIKISNSARDHLKARADKRREAQAQKDREALATEWENAKAAHMEELHGEALEMNKEYDDEESAFAANTEHDKLDEAHQMEDEYRGYAEAEVREEAAAIREQEAKQNAYDAKIRARYARYRKSQRKAGREKFYSDAREKGNEVWTKTKRSVIGRTALKVFKFLKRGSKAALAGAKAAGGATKEAWKQQ